MIIKSMMSRKVVTVRRFESVKNSVKKMAQKSISCLVVAEKKMPIGIFTKRDLLGMLDYGMDLNKTKIDAVMRTPVMPIDENDTFLSAARRMGLMDVRRFIVVDKAGKLSGIVTQTDIIKYFATRSFPYNLTLATIASSGYTATPVTPLKKIARTMIENRITCVTVLKNRKPVGLLTEQYLVKLSARAREPIKGRAGERMIKKFSVVNIEQSMRESVLRMIKDGSRNLVLVDDGGRYAGVVEQKELVAYIEKSQH
ncbi:MAG: CBS domain-containing protein [Nitrospinota bacterium]